ncbi:hypothetical protein ACP70R_038146 [Stipagrostis hirtigluma subsp. patula]
MAALPLSTSVPPCGRRPSAPWRATSWSRRRARPSAGPLAGAGQDPAH